MLLISLFLLITRLNVEPPVEEQKQGLVQLILNLHAVANIEECLQQIRPFTIEEEFQYYVHYKMKGALLREYQAGSAKCLLADKHEDHDGNQYDFLSIILTDYGAKKNKQKRKQYLEEDFYRLKKRLEQSLFLQLDEENSHEEGEAPEIEKYEVKAGNEKERIALQFFKIRGGCFDRAEIYIKILK